VEYTESESKKKNILVVEDELDILHLLSDTFQYYGFNVDAESEANLALNKFHRHPKAYDAIILDLKLGSTNGKNLYKKIKEVDLNTKIFVFTGLEFDSAEFRKICPSFEDQYLIKKPVRMSSLVERVKSVLD
jgi:DNA-binding response OmpR family regulator